MDDLELTYSKVPPEIADMKVRCLRLSIVG